MITQITYISSDIHGPQPLTPLHLLYGRKITLLPHQRAEDDEVDDPTLGGESQLQHRAKLQTLLIQHFRSRWRKEYLTSLWAQLKSTSKELR